MEEARGMHEKGRDARECGAERGSESDAARTDAKRTGEAVQKLLALLSDVPQIKQRRVTATRLPSIVFQRSTPSSTKIVWPST